MAEYLVLFFGLVGGYAAVRPPGTPLLPLLLLTPLLVWYLRRSTAPAPLQGTAQRRTGVAGTAGTIRDMLPLWCAAAVLAVIAVALIDPGRLFFLPRERPLLWAILLVAYPLLSVYPQELLFRAFLMHRYGPAFGGGVGLASAVAFGFAHIIYGSVLSVALTTVGGWLFARRYRRTGSLSAACAEHTLYGLLAFTVGLDHLFYDDGSGD